MSIHGLNIIINNTNDGIFGPHIRRWFSSHNHYFNSNHILCHYLFVSKMKSLNFITKPWLENRIMKLNIYVEQMFHRNMVKPSENVRWFESYFWSDFGEHTNNLYNNRHIRENSSWTIINLWNSSNHRQHKGMNLRSFECKLTKSSSCFLRWIFFSIKLAFNFFPIFK